MSDVPFMAYFALLVLALAVLGDFRRRARASRQRRETDLRAAIGKISTADGARRKEST